jgi:hypothetical protein
VEDVIEAIANDLEPSGHPGEVASAALPIGSKHAARYAWSSRINNILEIGRYSWKLGGDTESSIWGLLDGTPRKLSSQE